MTEGQYIRVKSGRKDNRIVLFERDARHPKVGDMNECYIAGPGIFEVGETDRVRELLVSRHLLLVDDPAAAAVSDDPSGQDINQEAQQPNSENATALVDAPTTQATRRATN